MGGLWAKVKGVFGRIGTGIKKGYNWIKDHFSTIKDVADNQLNDLEQAKRILAIRQYRLDSGEPDIFLPDIGTPSPEDIDSAQNIADLLEYAIDRSDGNNKIFVSTLESRLVDNRYLR